MQPPTAESWSPDDALRHWAYGGIAEGVRAWWSMIRPDDAPMVAPGLIRMLDFGSEWYGDASGVGWASYMRGMLRRVIQEHAISREHAFGRMGEDVSKIDPVSHTLATYPPHDVQRMPEYVDASFDVAVVDNVLEHVERPWLAAAELRRVLRPGGVCVAMTPGLYPVHPSPLDCWRILPDGYRALFPASEWETLACDAWGSKEWLMYELECNGAFPEGLPQTTVAEQSKIPGYGGFDGRFPLMVWWVGVKR